MSTSTVKETPNWKKWDIAMIDAWMMDDYMYVVACSFLSSLNVSVEDLPKEGRLQKISEIFLLQGVKLRGPKAYAHLRCRAKAFFYNFFPTVNDLLWEGKKVKALDFLRKYKTTDSDQYRVQGDVQKVKREFSIKKTSDNFPIIPGTNAMHIDNSRRTKSDWKTVKPSRCRSR